jgi:hypothetical protein
MNNNSGEGKLPSFGKRPGGMLSKVETDVSAKAVEGADKAAPIGDEGGGVIPAQHCSHASHGSHGSHGSPGSHGSHGSHGSW